MLTDFSSWLHTLPLWAQPIVATAIPCFPVLLLLMIRNRIKLHQRGERFTPRKTKAVEYLGAVAFFAALYYANGRYTVAAQILGWPDRTFPMWHQHGGAMIVGFVLAGYAARILSALYAALFLRGGGGQYGGGYQPVGQPTYIITRFWHR